MNPLCGKTALITGSSRGIGKAIAWRLANEGAQVCLNARSNERIEEMVASLPAPDGQRHHYIVGDISRVDQIAAMMEDIQRRWGKLDILVNNAGLTRFIPHEALDQLTPELFDQIYKVNLRGAFCCVQKGLGLLRASGDALVVNVASIAATTAVGSNIAYCALKAAMVNMTASLARALAPTIRVNAVSPGLTDTGMSQTWQTYRNEQIGKTPLGRLGSCEDIAGAVMAMMTDLRYMTGQDLVLDGGRTLM